MDEDFETLFPSALRGYDVDLFQNAKVKFSERGSHKCFRCIGKSARDNHAESHENMLFFYDFFSFNFLSKIEMKWTKLMGKNAMDCPVCMEKVDDGYTVNCGSVVPHVLCHACELKCRLGATVSSRGRLLKCPLCRAVELAPGNRSATSLQAELNSVYAQQVQQQVQQVPQVPSRYLANQQHLRSLFPESHSRELREYNELVRRRQQERDAVRRSAAWCHNSPCPTKSKTTRKCRYPVECTRNVCRACNMCESHFDF